MKLNNRFDSVVNPGELIKAAILLPQQQQHIWAGKDLNYKKGQTKHWS